MIEIKAPTPWPPSDRVKIFLAGIIELDMAERWQDWVVERLRPYDVTVFNPRREHWDSSWRQRKDNPEFRRQVEWELDAMEQSDYIILYFDPKTKAPISLAEMGLFAHAGKIWLVCPEGYWRKGNVDIVAERYHIPQFGNLEELLDKLIAYIKITPRQNHKIVL